LGLSWSRILSGTTNKEIKQEFLLDAYMKESYIVWLVGIAIVVALVVTGIQFGLEQQSPARGFVDTETTISTSTPEASDDSDSEAGQDGGGEVEDGEKDGKRTPRSNIALSPYSVYIGFASSVGTSSQSVLQQEVSHVVVGYEWEALPFSPMFSTAILPNWDDSEEGKQKAYTVHVWDEDSYTVLGTFSSADEIKFPREGLRGASRFKVTGIDPELRICPGDRSFTWDMRFTLEGQLGLIRTPITQDLPQNETCRMRR